MSAVVRPRHGLRDARESAGLTLRRVQAITRINFRKIFLFEHGLRPTDQELALLAAAYHLGPDQLREALGLDEPEPVQSGAGPSLRTKQEAVR